MLATDAPAHVSATPPTVRAALGFTPPEDVSPDGARPGLLRAAPRQDPPRIEDLDMRTCELRDLAAGGPAPSLTTHGFTTVTLPERESLRDVLQGVRRQAALRPTDEAAIRRSLRRSRIPLPDGSQLLVLHIAGEGMIFRAAGPDGVELGGQGLGDEHGAASAVHADQDIGGTPLRQMLRGVAPRLFRHEAPDSRNRRSPLMLVNLWLPLQQVTNPLALMDTTSLDRRTRQLRFELPLGGILERDESRSVNDIWTFLHDERQEWHFHSAPELGDAHVFDTLSTPHGSFVIPGEDVAADRYRRIDGAIAALEAGLDLPSAELSGPAPAGQIGTLALQQAIARMDGCLAELGGGLQPTDVAGWIARARAAQRAVIRLSIEMRAVVVRIPAVGRRAGR